MGTQTTTTMEIDRSLRTPGLKHEALAEFAAELGKLHGVGREICILRNDGTGSYILNGPWSDAAKAFFDEDPRIEAAWDWKVGAHRIRTVGMSSDELVHALAGIFDGVVRGIEGDRRILHVLPDAERPSHAAFPLLDRPVSFRRDELMGQLEEIVPRNTAEGRISLFLGSGGPHASKTVQTLPETVWTRHPFLLIHVQEKSKERFAVVWNTTAGTIQHREASSVANFLRVVFQDAAVRLGSPSFATEAPADDPWAPKPPGIVRGDMEELVRRVSGSDVAVLDAGLVRYWGRLHRPASVPTSKEVERLVHVASHARCGRPADRRGEGGRAGTAPPMVLLAPELLSPDVDRRDLVEAVLHEAAHALLDVATPAVRDGEARRTLEWACACALMNARLPRGERISGVDLVSLEGDGDPDLEWWRREVGPEAVGWVQSFLDDRASSSPDAAVSGRLDAAARAMAQDLRGDVLARMLLDARSVAD